MELLEDGAMLLRVTAEERDSEEDPPRLPAASTLPLLTDDETVVPLLVPVVTLRVAPYLALFIAILSVPTLPSSYLLP